MSSPTRSLPSATPTPQMFWAQWAVRDLPTSHWHLGPVGVEPGYQGQGVGIGHVAGLVRGL